MTKLNKILTVVLIVALLSALGFLGYILTTPKISEGFTEFYILDRNGQTKSYPVEFIVNNTEVTQVRYSDNIVVKTDYAYITMGLVNYENKEVEYTIRAMLDRKTISLDYEGRQVSSVESIAVVHGEKWEGIVGFALTATGDNQKVVFMLDRDSARESDTLHLWVDVKKRD